MRAHRCGKTPDTMRSAEMRKRRSETLPKTCRRQRMPCLIPPWTEPFHREQERTDSSHREARLVPAACQNEAETRDIEL